MMTPTTVDPMAWHLYIRAAENFAVAQERMEQAVGSGVDFAALLALQGSPA